MQLECPACHRVLEFSGQRPLFCAYCGHALDDTKSGSTADFDPEAATLLPPDSQTWEVGSVPEAVGGYRLLRPLGTGGMGTVYEAEETASGRHVALKLIAPEYARSAESLQRFRQEGRLASLIVHPRCVFVYAADEEAGQAYIVMELMPGSTLQDLVKERGPLPPEEAVAKVLDVIEGLQEAHRLGVIHRDVKPSNCFLEANGRVKIGDFGLSKSLIRDAHLTKMGAFLGTPAYASPEQIKCEPVDPQCDVYSVAATLYFLLTGQPPFHSGDAAATLARIVSDPAPSMRTLRRELPPALDQAVLRGLERHRERRWPDLEAFRHALRPFLTGKPTRADLGIRFGAYLIDLCLLALIGMVVTILLLVFGWTTVFTDPTSSIGWSMQVLYFLPSLLCFAIPEGLWGVSLGKYFLRLRVGRVDSNDPPGLSRACLRTLCFYVLRNVGDLAALLIVTFAAQLPAHPTPRDVQEHLSVFVWSGVAQWLGWFLGIGLVLCTMRGRNGMRGLHEFLSGTRVFRLPEPKKRLRGQSSSLDAPLSQPQGLPERVGPFVIRGALRWTGTVNVVLGEDPALERTVLIWLRPAAARSLSLARRGISRLTRLRWVSCGRHEDWQWDAFLAPSGCALADLVRSEGPRPWWEARLILEQLTDEVVHAHAEGSLPWVLRTDQIWIQTNGRVLLLDVSWGTSDAAADEEEQRPTKEMRQEQAFALLGQTAVLALEGQARPAADPPVDVRAPVACHARRLLHRLVDFKQHYPALEQFQDDLAASRKEPTEVTRVRRAAHLAVLGALLFIGLGSGLFFSFAPELQVYSAQKIRIVKLQFWADRLDHDIARICLLAPPASAPFLHVPAELQLDQDLRLREELRATLRQEQSKEEALLASFPQVVKLVFVRQVEPAFMMGSRSEIEREIGRHPFAALDKVQERVRRELNAPQQGSGLLLGLTAWVLTPLLMWPALWVIWAFLARGGLSFRLLGFALARKDGRPAARWQCAWRALLVWVPVYALLVLAILMSGWYWAAWDIKHPYPHVYRYAQVAWWLAVALLPSYVFLALRFPTRSLHDRLAGTYLVPR
jgi:hypothetical protein